MKKTRLDTRNASEQLTEARILINDAVNRINQSRMAAELHRELKELYRIEDVLWQLAAACKEA